MENAVTEVLNFSAKMASDYPEDRRRMFVVSYYLADKTMAVFEADVPNSGFRHGKFLQRMRARDPATNKYFEPSAFYVGAKILVAAQTFDLIDAAPHTFCVMEAHADEFPESAITHVIQRLIDACKQTTQSVRGAFEHYDPGKRGTCRSPRPGRSSRDSPRA